MPWWGWAWVALLASLTVAGLVQDLHDREPSWFTWSGFLAGNLYVALVLSYFGVIALPYAPAVAVLAFVLMVLEMSVVWQRDTESEGVQRWLLFTLSISPILPAIALGFL